MVLGFVLISVTMSRERDVYEALREVEEVVECHPLFGEYDIIAKVEAPSYDGVGRVVVDKIRKIPGVTDTKTLTQISVR